MEQQVVEETKLDNATRLEEERREKIFNDYLNSTEYVSKLLLRAKLFDATQDGHKDYMVSRGTLYELCRNIKDPVAGCIFFIENFGWTFSPKTAQKHLPFILFDFQKKAIGEIIHAIDNGHDLFIEKSREMGATWLFFVYVPLWYWLFREGTNILVGSYKEALVDNKMGDSIFGKIDYALTSIPKWLLPKKFNPVKHRNKLKLINPENLNAITGDTMNPQFGRGARKTAVLFDELGFWDYAKDAWEACADTTNCRVANSTPYGRNFFALLRESGIKILTMIWKDHPLKDQMWYDYEKLRRTPETFAREIDISYTQSMEGRVYPDWNELNIERGLFNYDPDLPLYIGWDFGATDDTAIIWAQPFKGKLRIIDTYRNTGKIIDFYVAFITGISSSEFSSQYTAKDLEKIASHRYWKRATHFGDPAGRFGNQATNFSVIDILKNHGIIVNFKDSWKTFNVRKETTRKLILNGIQLNMNDATRYFDTCIINASYPKVKNAGVDEVRSVEPKHDFTSHYRSALEYLALGLSEFKPKASVPVDKFKKGLRRFNSGRVVGY